MTDFFSKNIDSDKYTDWINKTGLWFVIPPEVQPPQNDDDNKDKPVHYVPLKIQQSFMDNANQTPEEAQTGQNTTISAKPPNTTVDVYSDNPSVEPDTPDLDPGYNDPNTDIDNSANIFDALKQFWQDVKNGFANLIEKVSSIWTSVKTIVSTSNSILEAIRGLADLLIPGFVEAFTESFTVLFKQLAEWLKPLMDYLLDGLKTLFVPKTGYLDQKILQLRQKFGLADSVLGTLSDLKAFLLNLGSVPPVIYIDLSSATGSWYLGAETIFVDLRWYAQYKPTMDFIISAFLWLWFAWRVIQSLPGLIQGTSGFWKEPEVVKETGLTVASSWYDRR